MNVVFAIFIFGCFVTALVLLGLVFSVAALGDGSFGGFEGKARDDEQEP